MYHVVILDTPTSFVPSPACEKYVRLPMKGWLFCAPFRYWL